MENEFLAGHIYDIEELARIEGLLVKNEAS